MKFAWPESQMRSFLKCGNMAGMRGVALVGNRLRFLRRLLVILVERRVGALDILLPYQRRFAGSRIGGWRPGIGGLLSADRNCEKKQKHG